jgi:methylated-DNA-[protein]-cysteine S-methyltransferase
MKTMLRGVLCSLMETAVGEVWVVHDGAEPITIRPAGPAAEVEGWCLANLGVVPEPVALPTALRRLLEDAAAGRGGWRPRFDGLGDFQRRVLLEACEIPPGETRSYAWLAARVGHPGAARAVGTALARNPLPLVVPCHRVVRADGRIGHYGCGGPAAKRALLREEGVALEPGGRLPDKELMAWGRPPNQ